MWSHLSCELLVKCLRGQILSPFSADWTGWETKKGRANDSRSKTNTLAHLCARQVLAHLLLYWDITTQQMLKHKWKVNSGRLGKGKEHHQFVSPMRAVFVQTGLNNALPVQVPDKLARETRCECGKTDVHNLLRSASPPSIILHF